MQEKIIMFKWESEQEFLYRTIISDIGLKVGNILNKVADYGAKRQIKNNDVYVEAKKIINTEYNKLFALKVPIIYSEIDNLLRQSCDYYLKAFDLLIEIFNGDKIIFDKKNVGPVNKAAQFITAGNSYTNIVSCKNFELFERQQTEYYKAKNRINSSLLTDKGEING